MFKYLNIMEKIIYCDDISNDIMEDKKKAITFFGLITGTYLVYNILLTYYHFSLKNNRSIRPRN